MGTNSLRILPDRRLLHASSATQTRTRHADLSDVRRRKVAGRFEPQGERILRTDISLEYRKSRWGLARLVLDGVSNHLPSDSGGSRMIVKIRQGNKWLDLQTADPDKPTQAVMILDNGRGYDAKFLSVLFSSKSSVGENVGQFGEGGTKMGPAAALRNGVWMELRSRDWIATPFVETLSLNGNPVDRLCFRVVPNKRRIKGSRTLFIDPPKELMDEIFRLPQQVLTLQPQLETLYTGFAFNQDYRPRIISVPEAKPTLYVKGVAVKPISAVFSYDLGIEALSPDRAHVDTTVYLDALQGLLVGCSKREVLEQILRVAHDSPNQHRDEFQALDPWRKSVSMDENNNPYNFSLFTSLGLKINNRFNKIKFMNKNGYGAKELDEYWKNDPNRNLIVAFYDRTSYLLNERKISSSPTQSSWSEAFNSVFGEAGKDLVLANDNNPGANQDAALKGYKVVKLHASMARFLHQQGIPDAQDLKLGGKEEYRYVDPADLNPSEQATLNRIRTLNTQVLETDLDPEVRVFEGLYSATGREIESSLGVQITEDSGRRFLGIKRSLLARPRQFDDVYIHEAGHLISQKGDHDEDFSHFFVRALARILDGKLDQEPLQQTVERQSLLSETLARAVNRPKHSILKIDWEKLAHGWRFTKSAKPTAKTAKNTAPVALSPIWLNANQRNYTNADEEIESSVSLAYREKKWGIRRMLLDAVSNHLPHDSGATGVGVWVVQDGHKIDIRKAAKDRPIEALIIGDNGRGYDTPHLHLLYSTKEENSKTVGQFGEGLKLTAAAALRAGIAMEYRSKDWRAVPFTKPDEVEGKPFNRLCYQVERCKEAIQGSHTIFHHPPQELIDLALALPDQILDLYGKYSEHFVQVTYESTYDLIMSGQFLKQAYPSRIVSLHSAPSNGIYVKGVRVKELRDALFSYDLGIPQISPDRDQVDEEILGRYVRSLLTQCTDEHVLEALLRHAGKHQDRPCFELQNLNESERDNGNNKMLGYRPSDEKDPWELAFNRVYGENAVLDEPFKNTGRDEAARRLGYNPIRLNQEMRTFLKKRGVQTSDTVINQARDYQWVVTDALTEDERNRLDFIAQINQQFFSTLDTPPVHIFAGLLNKAGEEVESPTSTSTIRFGRHAIALKRSLLTGDRRSFLEAYLRELSCQITGEHFSSRNTVDFLTGCLAEFHAVGA